MGSCLSYHQGPELKRTPIILLDCHESVTVLGHDAELLIGARFQWRLCKSISESHKAGASEGCLTLYESSANQDHDKSWMKCAEL